VCLRLFGVGFPAGRPVLGTAGRVENAQVAVYLTYAGRGRHALIDRRLYLPRLWAGDPARRAATGIPDDVQFATKPALAAAMIAAAVDAGVPAAWVAGDEVYGADPGLRADVLAARLLRASWQRLSAGSGKGLAGLDEHQVRTWTAGTGGSPWPCSPWPSYRRRRGRLRWSGGAAVLVSRRYAAQTRWNSCETPIAATPDRPVAACRSRYAAMTSALRSSFLNRTLRDVIGLRERGDRGAEPRADLLHQRWRGNRQAQVLRHERDHLPAGLQDRHIGVQVDPVQALDIQDRMTVENLARRHHTCAHARLLARNPRLEHEPASHIRPASGGATARRSRVPEGKLGPPLPTVTRDNPHLSGTAPPRASAVRGCPQ